jgi:hypothetical protein
MFLKTLADAAIGLLATILVLFFGNGLYQIIINFRAFIPFLTGALIFSFCFALCAGLGALIRSQDWFQKHLGSPPDTMHGRPTRRRIVTPPPPLTTMQHEDTI